jgi:hypothetical protein
MTDLEIIKSLLDGVGKAYGINVPEYTRPGRYTITVGENYAAATFTFDNDGTLIDFEVES